MKEKNTLPSKGKSIFYLMLSLIATLFVSSFIYFLVLHPSLDNKAVRISINIGETLKRVEDVAVILTRMEDRKSVV